MELQGILYKSDHVKHRERVVRAGVHSEHLVQLFDTPETLATSVGTFLAEGYHSGDTLLVVVASANWSRIKRQMLKLECPIDTAIADGQMVALDAGTTLARFAANGIPDPEQFDATVGELVRRLARDREGRGLRIYGEMVDVLVHEGNFEGAQELEELWCALGEQTPLTLFCGYSSIHFGDPRSGVPLERICRLHDRVLSHDDDVLGSWLVSRVPAAS